MTALGTSFAILGFQGGELSQLADGNIDFTISFIGKDYPGENRKLFDPAYMRGLYRYGFERGQTPDFREKRPPDQDE